MEKLPVDVFVTYGCPLCGRKDIKTQEEAVACRDSHQDPGSVDGAKFAPGEAYPGEVTVLFPSGATGLYTLAGMNKQ